MVAFTQDTWCGIEGQLLTLDALPNRRGQLITRDTMDEWLREEELSGGIASSDKS